MKLITTFSPPHLLMKPPLLLLLLAFAAFSPPTTLVLGLTPIAPVATLTPSLGAGLKRPDRREAAGFLFGDNLFWILPRDTLTSLTSSKT